MKKIISLLLTTMMLTAYTPEAIAASELQITGNASVEKGKTMTVSCTLPARYQTFPVSASIEFDVNGTKAEGVRDSSNVYTAKFKTSTLPLGPVPISINVKSASGEVINSDTKYVNIVKSILAELNSPTSWIQASGATSNRKRTRSTTGTDTLENGYCFYDTASSSVGTSAYMYPLAFHEDFDKGYSGKIEMNIEMMSATTTDNISLYMYGNTPSSKDLTQHERVDMFVGLFGSNGCFYNSDIKYKANKWYMIKICIDTNEGKKQLYADDVLVYEGDIGGDYTWLGMPQIRLETVALNNRKDYASVSADNWGIYSKNVFFEKKLCYNKTIQCDNRMIPKTAEDITVTFNNPVKDLKNVKLLINGVEVTDAKFSLSEKYAPNDTDVIGYTKMSVALGGKIKTGDKIEIKLPSGTKYISALSVDGAEIFPVIASTDEDITIPVSVGTDIASEEGAEANETDGFYRFISTPDSSRFDEGFEDILLSDAVLCCLGTADAMTRGIGIFVNRYDLSVRPFIEGTSVYIPLRFICEAMHADIHYNASNGDIIVLKDGREAVMNVTSQSLVIDGNPMSIASPFKQTSGVSYVSLSDASKILHTNIYYDEISGYILATDLSGVLRKDLLELGRYLD